MTMRDCADGNMRDLLPDYVHGTLPGPERARVAAHLDACADCAAEVRLIESARSAYPVPVVDLTRIVASLPGARRTAAGGGLRSRQWLLAAGVSFIVLGAVSLAAIRGVFSSGSAGPAAVTSPVARTGEVREDQKAAPKLVSRAAHESLAAATPRPVGITFGGGLSDLSDDELTTLLREIDSLEASPSAEPEPHVKSIIPMREGGPYAR